MSKAYETIAEGYRMLAEGYAALAEDGAADGKAPKKEAKKTPKAAEAAETEPEQTGEEKTVTIEDIRAVMRAKNKEGKIEKCQAVLKEYGVAKLSDVPEEKYPELLKKVEVL